MKRVGLLLSMMAAASIAADYEVTPVAGVIDGIKNVEMEKLFGAELQYNGWDTLLKPELALLFTPDAEYDDSNEKTDVLRAALNGVYEYRHGERLVPFTKIGLGYESVDNEQFGNESDLFANIGAGVKSMLTDNVGVKLEALGMVKSISDDNDIYWGALVGLTYAFGGETAAEVVEAVEPAPAPAPEPEPVTVPDGDNDGVDDTTDTCPNTPTGVNVDAEGCALDSDHDGVADYLDQCADTQAGVKVDAQGCALDSDGDGVMDSLDTCPNTLKGFNVDAAGCPLTMDLELTFKTNSATIQEDSVAKVDAFGAFLKENEGYKVHIVGHTDDRGNALYNQKLSEKRAVAVRDRLVEQGVDAARLTTEGKGEAAPKADNATSEGREANRRIQVKLIK